MITLFKNLKKKTITDVYPLPFPLVISVLSMPCSYKASSLAVLEVQEATSNVAAATTAKKIFFVFIVKSF